MRKLVLAIALAIASSTIMFAGITPAAAKCGHVCQQKCAANPGPGSVDQCIARWSQINAKGQGYAVKKEREFRKRHRH